MHELTGRLLAALKAHPEVAAELRDALLVEALPNPEEPDGPVVSDEWAMRNAWWLSLFTRTLCPEPVDQEPHVVRVPRETLPLAAVNAVLQYLGRRLSVRPLVLVDPVGQQAFLLDALEPSGIMMAARQASSSEAYKFSAAYGPVVGDDLALVFGDPCSAIEFRTRDDPRNLLRRIPCSILTHLRPRSHGR